MAAQFPNVYQRAAQLQAEEAARVQAEQAALAAEAERTRDRTLGEVGRDTALSLSSGLGGLVGAGYGLANFATAGVLDRATGGAGSQFFQDWQQAMAEGQSAPLQARRQEISTAFDRGIGAGLAQAVSTPSVLADMAVQSLPYFIPGLGAAGAAARATQAGRLAQGATEAVAGVAAATNATRAALAANAAVGGGLSSVDAINEARAAGLGESEQQLAGVGGFAAGALLSYGTQRLTGAAGLEASAAQRIVGAGGPAAAGSMAAQVGLGVAREATQEALEEGGQQAIRNVAGQRDIGEGVGESAALGGLLGGVFGGVLGAANVRKPSPVRDQLDAARAEVQAGLDAEGLSVGPRPLNDLMKSREAAQQIQAGIDAGTIAAEEIDLAATPLPQSVEEIDLAATPVSGLTGLNAIVAQQRAIQAQQPPRPLVQEISFDQYAPQPAEAVAGLPQVEELAPRSVEDIIRTTAPIERVAQQFGVAAAGAEAARRQAAATAEVPQAPALDVSTPRARGAYNAQVKEVLAQATGLTARSFRGEQFAAITDRLVEAGARPGTPEFAQIVGVETARQLGRVERAGGTSNVLGALSNAYPVVEDKQVEAAFDTTPVPTTEEALFGAAPVIEGLDTTSVSQLRDMLANTYWAETGGRLIRAEGDQGQVTGRTSWLSSNPQAQAVLSNTGYSVADVQGWLDRAATGQGRPLGQRQREIVEGLLSVLREQNANQQPADAAKPADVSMAPTRYNAQAWADYMAYPGSRQLNALTDLKEAEGNPQPVLAAMLYGIDLAGDMTELGQLSNAAQAHPEFALMPQESRSEVSNHIATAVNRITGATFELTGDVPARQYSADMQRLLAMTEDEYIAAVNPTGKRSDAADLVIVRQGDLDLPTNARREAVTTDRNGDRLDLHVDQAGTIYAVQNGEVVGQIESRDGETLNIVVQEAQGRGVGAALAAELIRRDPFAPAGSFSPAGEAARRAGFRLIKANPAKFKVSETPTRSIPKRLFDKGVETAERNYGRPIIGVDTTADLEIAAGITIPPSAKGMFLNGNIYVVRENISNGRDLAMTVAHEVGHSGLSALLGTSLNAATNRMWANPEMRKRIRAKQIELNMAQGTEAERRASRSLAAEEVLADMLAANERLNKDIWSKLRAGVREFFARVFGMRNYILTNKDVDTLLSDVAKVTRGAPAAQVRAELNNAELWLNAPEQAAESDPKFSKAKADLDQLIANAAAEGPAQVLPIRDIAKAAGEASVGAAKSVADAVRSNKIGGLWIRNAMHLNQLSDWYDKKFDGRIGRFAALKRAKEAAFNQLNSRPVALKYDGADVGSVSVNDIAKNWAKFGRQNPQKFQAMNVLLQDGTFYKVFPDRTWDQQNDVDYDAAGFTVEERREAHAQLVRLFDSIGSEGRTLYKQSQAVYEARWKARFDALLSELDRIGKFVESQTQNADGTVDLVRKYKNDIRLAMQRISEGPYSPLQRNGEYILVARNDQGEVVHFSAYDTQADAETNRKYVADRLRAEGMTNGVVTVSRQKDFNAAVEGAGRGNIEALTSRIRADLEGALPASLDPASRNQVMNTLTAGLTEAYLQSLPQNAFMKHARKRRNVQGYDTDAFRAFADYTLRSARDIASIRFDGQIGSALNDVQKFVDDTAAGRMRPQGEQGVAELDTQKLQEVADAVKRQHAASLEVVNNKAVNALSQGAFVYFMTSPSQMFLNATQTAMVALPRLAGIYGAGRAAREINRAVGQYFKSKFDLLNPDSVVNKNAQTDAGEAHVADTLRALFEDGTLDFTQAHDLAELSGGNNTALTPYMSKAMEVMSYAMHKSEVFNRQVTAAAAVRLELDRMRRDGIAMPGRGTEQYTQLQAQLADVARRAVDTTHFDYSQSNKPAVMQGPIGKLAFQFQQYRFHMLSMIGKDLRDAELGRLVGLKPPTNPQEAKVARETLAWLLGMQLAFVGTAGTIIAPFAFALADAFKDDDDLTTSRQDWINTVGKYAAHGVLADVIDTQRIAADTLIPYLGDKAYEPIGAKPSDVLMYHVSQNLGPWVGLLGDAFDGSAAIMNGDVYKASQDLLPKPFRDVTKSLYEGVNGARDARGIMYNEPSVLSGVTQFLGLRSAERRDVEAARGAVYRANATAYQLKDRYLTRLAAAFTHGDGEAIAEAQADIQSWNQRYPDFAIKGQDMARAVTTRARQEAIAAQTGIVSSRLPGATIDAVLGR